MPIPPNGQGICVFPGFVKQLLHIFMELKSADMCNGLSLQYNTIKKLEKYLANLAN